MMARTACHLSATHQIATVFDNHARDGTLSAADLRACIHEELLLEDRCRSAHLCP